jgi:tRNA threonylcarbamoyladenosine biosynthesis protein TsaE
MAIHTRSDAETRALGKKLSRALKGGDCLSLIGDLGSGKTTFVQGLAEGLGCRVRATSPTFVIAKTYKGKKLNLHHIDLYRIAADVTGDIGLEEFMRDPKAVCAVEWPQSGGDFFPKDHLELRFTHVAESERTIEVKATGPASRAAAEALS